MYEAISLADRVIMRAVVLHGTACLSGQERVAEAIGQRPPLMLGVVNVRSENTVHVS